MPLRDRAAGGCAVTGERARRLGWTAVALLALVGTVLALRPGADPEADVLVAGVDLAAGTAIAELSAPQLETTRVAWPDGVAPPPGPGEVLADARLAAPLAAGEALTWAALGGAPGYGPAPLAPGERAVALPASALGSSALSLPVGARVDLVSVAGSGRAGLLVADAEVLVVSPPGDGDGGGLLLRVPVADALAVAAGAGFATDVRVVARPPGERGDGGLPMAGGGPEPTGEVVGSSPDLSDGAGADP